MSRQPRNTPNDSAPQGPDRPWEEHLRFAFVLSALAFATAEFGSAMAAAALAALAFFVALRPLFLRQAAYSAIRSGNSLSYSRLTTA